MPGHHQEQEGSLGEISLQPLIEPAPRLLDFDFRPSRLKDGHFPLQHLLLFVILCYRSPKTFIPGGVSYVSGVSHDSDEPNIQAVPGTGCPQTL